MREIEMAERDQRPLLLCEVWRDREKSEDDEDDKEERDAAEE